MNFGLPDFTQAERVVKIRLEHYRNGHKISVGAFSSTWII